MFLGVLTTLQEGNAQRFGEILSYNAIDGIYTIKIIDSLSITTSLCKFSLELEAFPHPS